jgi:hypothetical protein
VVFFGGGVVRFFDLGGAGGFVDAESGVGVFNGERGGGGVEGL